ncbi:hypothetical protein VC83_04151 [Pseudogymnoascus destructans]|uniref:Uncharacterized protein n=2 Tax=Pseudogymnoascus destructans TaxID=655981 RepID=L8FY68_PSED2|nr:uncharacterized protein VC83_04151 [Pseudogymnoascus destructans]ELR04606.1 hypothetical protein GMDG_06888 [Pseudogymnoascus destructans 20631-21]OAF59153.1 hypothetical protein VC83_04151 [Pseudogymnoascus destructans]
MSNKSILAPFDAANLQNRGLLGPGNTTSSQRLHKRCLNRSSDEEHSDIPLSAPISSQNAFATIPAVLISLETLIYVGLSGQKANELWNQWTNWQRGPYDPRRETDPDDGGLTVTFHDFIIGWSVTNRADAVGDDDDHEWRKCLDACGIDAATQDAIMDPNFTYLRRTNSCLYWAKDTIEMRYAGLEEIQRTSLTREAELKQAAPPIPSGSEDAQGSGYQGNVGLTSTSSTSQGQRSISGLQQKGAAGIEADVCGSSRAIAALNAPGYTTLYKGLDQARITGLFDDSGAVAEIEILLSSAPSDFCGISSRFYFALDHTVARYYAAYVKKRAVCESVVIVCLQIPNAAIESLPPNKIQRMLWPSSEWKELVWFSRKGKTPPPHLDKYHERGRKWTFCVVSL